MLLSHVFLMMESLGGCRAVRLHYPALAGPESTLRVHKYLFFLKDCSFVQLRTLMARAQVSTSPLSTLWYSGLGKQGSCSSKFVVVTLSVRSGKKNPAKTSSVDHTRSASDKSAHYCVQLDQVF